MVRRECGHGVGNLLRWDRHIRECRYSTAKGVIEAVVRGVGSWGWLVEILIGEYQKVD
jgi:hypothetical protein